MEIHFYDKITAQVLYGLFVVLMWPGLIGFLGWKYRSHIQRVTKFLIFLLVIITLPRGVVNAVVESYSYGENEFNFFQVLTVLSYMQILVLLLLLWSLLNEVKIKGSNKSMDKNEIEATHRH